MRTLTVCLVAGMMVSGGEAPAQDGNGPEAAVGHIYDFYASAAAIGVWPTDPEVLPLFSDRLAAELEADDQRLESEGMGQLQFDPFIDGQDFAVDGLEIRTTSTSDTTATVDVMFLNFGEPTQLIYNLVLEDGEWRIDDIASPNSYAPWRLTEILGD